MDFVAIDFETANSKRSSACCLGIAAVRDNEIAYSDSWFINPTPCHYDSYNTFLHGISCADTDSAPTFDEVWREIRPLVSGGVVVAHNAAFDMSVMRNALTCYGVAFDEFQFLCTYKLSQLAYPLTGVYRLNNLCSILGISLDHHAAKSDALGCANLLLHIMQEHGLSSIQDIARRFNISPGVSHPNGYTPCSSSVGHPKSYGNISVSEINALDPIYIDDDFNGKHFAFTGTLASMSRPLAQRLVVQAGGIAQNGVTKQTNYLVIGIQDESRFAIGKTMSSKTLKALELAKQGQNIQIIYENDFTNMIDDELWAHFVEQLRKEVFAR